MDFQAEEARRGRSIQEQPKITKDALEQQLANQMPVLNARYFTLQGSIVFVQDLFHWTNAMTTYVIRQSGEEDLVHCFERALVPQPFVPMALATLPYPDHLEKRMELNYEAIYEIGDWINQMSLKVLQLLRQIRSFQSRHRFQLQQIARLQDRDDADSTSRKFHIVSVIMHMQHNISRDIYSCLENIVSVPWEAVLVADCHAVEDMSEWRRARQMSLDDDWTTFKIFQEENLRTALNVTMGPSNGDRGEVIRILAEQRKVSRYSMAKVTIERMAMIHSHVAVAGLNVGQYGHWVEPWY